MTSAVIGSNRASDIRRPGNDKATTVTSAVELLNSILGTVIIISVIIAGFTVQRLQPAWYGGQTDVYVKYKFCYCCNDLPDSKHLTDLGHFK